jgi:hypothetical protein
MASREFLAATMVTHAERPSCTGIARQSVSAARLRNSPWGLSAQNFGEMLAHRALCIAPAQRAYFH